MHWLQYIQIAMRTRKWEWQCAKAEEEEDLWSSERLQSIWGFIAYELWERVNEKTAFQIGRGKDPFEQNSGSQRTALEEGLRGTGITALICIALNSCIEHNLPKVTRLANGKTEIWTLAIWDQYLCV